jgi:flavin reductase (DIM6/NTAB) family NADH-FMN oxidoreductase RutF
MTPAEAEAFKAAMRRFATGVTVVTTMLEGKPKGFTATAFCSVSAEPPMVLVCVNRRARSHPIIAQAGYFCVNVLAREQEEIAVRFSSRTEDPFAGLAHHTATTGAPALDDSLAFFDCALSEELSVETHTIFVGRVIACGNREGAPLGYYDGAYRNFGLS